MSLAITQTRANIGIDAPIVTVEVHLSNGLPGFSMVGLPETAVKESKERVRSAIINSHLEFPARRITVNLAPAEIPKQGGRYDLAIALGILAASGQISDEKLGLYDFYGELALSGEVKQVKALFPSLLCTVKLNRPCIIPVENASEAAVLSHDNIALCRHLIDVVGFFTHAEALEKPERVCIAESSSGQKAMDLADVVGQQQATRALIIAAAGGHNLLFKGPPGTGKTMLASRMISILPDLNKSEALEVAAIQSISGNPVQWERWQQPPFRSPHHSASAVALVGGGKSLKAGEVSLAHRGVLFLDELPEFSPKVLEGLREPLESGFIQISRAAYEAILPATFQLVATCNLCPCGNHGDPAQTCQCTPEQIRKYQQRMSGPLLDRIDMHVQVQRMNKEDQKLLLVQRKKEGRSSKEIKQQVCKAIAMQQDRQGCKNARLQDVEIHQHCALHEADKTFFLESVQQLRLSTRGALRVLKVARTIADLEKALNIKRQHLLEALSYRSDLNNE